MAPAVEPKKRVKSIKKPPGDSPITKTKKIKEYKRFSNYINLIFRNVLRKKTELTRDAVLLILKMFRNMIDMIGKEAYGLVTRRKKKIITIREAQLAVANVIPGDLGYRAHLSAMDAISEFRRRHARGLARAAIA